MLNKTSEREVSVDFLLDWLLEQGTTWTQLREGSSTVELGKRRTPVQLSLKKYLEFFNEAAQTVGDESLGMRVGRDVDVKAFGYVGLFAHYCSTLRESWRAFEKYLCTIYPQMVLRLHEGRTSRITYHITGFPAEKCRQDVEMSLGSIVLFFRQYGSDEWNPIRVEFEHSPPSDPTPYTVFYGTDVTFDKPRSQIVFDTETLDTKVSNTDPSLLKIMRDHAETELSAVERNNSLVSNVRYLVSSSIGTEQCNSVSVANSLFMSQRSLNRHLKENQTSFRKIKQEVIEEISRRTLGEATTSITELAFKLGYAETAAFDRAFKKMTNMSPSEYQRSKNRL